MGLSAQLEPLVLPSGTEFPGTPQQLLAQIAAYMAIVGLDTFNGINFGPTQPSENNRDKPWFKTDNSGNPIGWYAWTGAAWVSIPITLPAGPTSGRPSAPAVGTEYFDTDINVALVFERSQWRTLAGSPGDTKCVRAASVTDAITANPGWAHDTDSINMVESGALADASNAGTTAGVDKTNITQTQMPSHNHTGILLEGSTADIGDIGPYVVTNPGGQYGPQAIASSSTGATGGADQLDLRQPTIYRIRIYKL